MPKLSFVAEKMADELTRQGWTRYNVPPGKHKSGRHDVIKAAARAKLVVEITSEPIGQSGWIQFHAVAK